LWQVCDQLRRNGSCAAATIVTTLMECIVMRKSSLLPATLCAALIFSGAASSHEVTSVQRRASAHPISTLWVGFAVAPNGRVFQSSENVYEDSARQYAKTECELKVGRTCRAIAVPQAWNVSVVVCARDAFVAGVPEGSATPLANTKADNAGAQDCAETYSY
jgi:hypothetical protein